MNRFESPLRADFRASAPRGDARAPRRPVPAARWRVWVVVAAICVGFAGVTWKSARLQLVLGDDLRGLAEEQYLRKVAVTAPRGGVFDAEGRHLAVSLPAWSVFAEPRRVVDVDVTAERVAAAMGVPVAEVVKKIGNDRAFVWLERRVAPDVADKVRALDVPGIGLRKEWRRTWPNKQLAAQILGGVDVDGNGRGGIEQAFDEQLLGRSTRLDALADNKGDRVALLDGTDEVFDLATLAGDDIVLTLDLPLQQAAEEILEATRNTFKAKAAWAVVLDAKTGAIRAIAQSPAYNPNTGEGDRRNHGLADAIEPGSIFKIATFAAALDEGVITQSDLIDCENGRFNLGRHTIHDSHKLGVVTAREVFKESSNIGTLKIAQRLGEDRFKTHLQRFGFGQRPGTGLLDESAGRLPRQDRWGETRLATVAFGHGVMVTSMQMASLLQAVANDGVRKRPYLVEKVRSATGTTVEEHVIDDGERVLSSKAATEMLSIMESVVEVGGTGALAAIPGVRVAGKTGTAEKVDPVTGRYSKVLHISSFLGVAPADNPKIVAVVVVDEPHGVVFGGQTAGPAWRAIVERALVIDGAAGVANLEAANAEVKKQKTEAPSLTELAEPAPPAVPAVPSGTVVMPDVRGLSARVALRAIAPLGAEVVVSGHGLVLAQEPGPGMPLDGPVRLALEDPSALSAVEPAKTKTKTTKMTETKR
jgi:cell division protein FtsI (penicillin-binding protein 3)